MRRIICLSAAAALLCLTSAESAETPPKQLAARTELPQIQTLTLSDQKFLKGDSAGGAAVTITGQLRIAQGMGRLPVVVLQHGSAGITGGVDAWSQELNALGISTFVLDGFSGRGLTDVNSNQAALGRLNFIVDIYRALDLLAKHPRVDPSRIALIGFSRGGQAALYASLRRFHKLWNKSAAQFAAYIAFYPDCMTTYVSDSDVVGQPIRIFGGKADDYDPISACKAYVDRLRTAGADIKLTEYPNAPHTFDNPLSALPPVLSATSQTVRSCKIREAADGVLLNDATQRPFTYDDACVEHGAHFGYDPAAAQAARAAVNAFLRTVFKLD